MSADPWSWPAQVPSRPAREHRGDCGDGILGSAYTLRRGSGPGADGEMLAAGHFDFAGPAVGRQQVTRRAIGCVGTVHCACARSTADLVVAFPPRHPFPSCHQIVSEGQSVTRRSHADPADADVTSQPILSRLGARASPATAHC